MDVSIIIVNYNTKQLTFDCLKSVYEQTKDIDFEVFVSDNGSTDGSTESIKEQFSQVHLIENRTNLGFGAANNRALKFTKVKPYDESNELEEFKTDPFELSRLFYKKDGVQQVVLIHPDCKKTIVKELERFNITEDFIYPDMDTVANEINERINFRK